MFRKVLVADDLGSINQGILSALSPLAIKNVHAVQYCDDAFLRIKKAIIDKEPFDLFITDLSFKADHREQNYKSGEELIAALLLEAPDLKIIAYSIEDRLHKIKKLTSNPNVNGYVCKGRQGLKELTEAITAVHANQQYLSPKIVQALTRKDRDRVDEYDLSLLKKLSQGLSQEEIGKYFKENNIIPCSLSSIEKNLNRLKIQFKAKNTTHLVALVKDLGLI